MSVFSTIKGLVDKINEHTRLLKDYNEDIEEILDRLDVLDEEAGEEGELEQPTGETVPSSEEEEIDEEALKLEE